MVREFDEGERDEEGAADESRGYFYHPPSY